MYGFLRGRIGNVATYMAFTMAMVFISSCTAAPEVNPADEKNEAEVTVDVAVLNFVNQVQGPDGEEWNWLEKGLADLLINDLARHPRLQLVSREQMQLAVMQIKLAGPLMPEWQESVTKQLGVARAVFGSYMVRDGKATVNASVIDTLTGQAVADISVEGDAEDILKLEKKLAAGVLDAMTGVGSGEFVAKLPVWTDSVPASRLLYEGVDHFDYGRYEEAWLNFRRALKKDNKYADARYWLGRMYYYQLQYRHAMAALVPFIQEYPNHPRAGDAVMELVRAKMLTSSGSLSDIVDYCHSLMRLADHRSYVWYPVRDIGHIRMKARTYLHLCLGDLYWQAGQFRQSAEQFYLAWQDKKMPMEPRGEVRHFFDEAAWYAQRVPPVCRNETVMIQTGNRRFTGTLQHEPVLGTNAFTFNVGWFECDEEHYIDEVDLTLSWREKFKGRLITVFEPQPFPDNPAVFNKSAGEWELRFKYLPQPTRQHINVKAEMLLDEVMKNCEGVKYDISFRLLPKKEASSWLIFDTCPEGIPAKVRFRDGRTAPLATALALYPGRTEASLEFSAESMAAICSSESKTITLQPNELRKMIFDVSRADIGDCAGSCWRPVSTVKFAQSEPILCRSIERCPDRDFVPGQALKPRPKDAKPAVIYGEEGRITYYDGFLEQGSSTHGYYTKKVIPQILTGKGGRLILYTAAFGDIWLATSDDNGRSWSDLRRLPCPVNSAHWEKSPSLILGDEGRYCLAFQSDRNILRRFWPYACFSEDLEHWSRPAKISEVVSETLHLSQDIGGEYMLAQGTSEGIRITRSENARQWRQPELVWATDKTENRRVALFEGGFTHVQLFQWPDGTYQICAIRLQPTADVRENHPDGYYQRQMLFVGRSADLKNWTDWHMPAECPPAKFSVPSFCHVPGRGLLLYGSYTYYNWLWSKRGTDWQGNSGPAGLWDENFALAAMGDDEMLAVSGGVARAAQLPYFVVMLGEKTGGYLDSLKWKPIPPKTPLHGLLRIPWRENWMETGTTPQNH